MSRGRGALDRFNPRNTGLYEARLWQAYYDRRWLLAVALLYRLLRSQFNLGPLDAARATSYGIRAATVFAPVAHDDAAVRRLLEGFYGVVRQGTDGTFDPREVGAAEYAYWEIHREVGRAGRTGVPELIDALARLSSTLYGVPTTDVRAAAVERARACDLVDAITAGRQAPTRAAWATIEETLRRSYASLRAALRPAEHGVGDAGTTNHRGGTATMSANDYHFITRWRVEGTARDVADIIGDPLGLASWWPSVYLRVRRLQPGDAHDRGAVYDLYTKGWLPYTLRWSFRLADVRYPNGSTIEAWGDFVGRGIWTFTQCGSSVDVTYDWRIRADKPLLRRLSFLLKPVFAANHRWAMARGEESLRLELARRRAATPAEAAAIPAPPGPTRLWTWTRSLPMPRRGSRT